MGLLEPKFKPNTKDYPDTEVSWLQEACGLLPFWVMEWDILKRRDPAYPFTLLEYMTERYGFGTLFEFKGAVDPDTQEYLSPYEEDEPLKPYGQVQLSNGGVVLIYPYAMIAIPTKDGYFISRMD